MKNIREFFGLTYYTSELDLFLDEFDSTHPQLSTSQRKEKEKYARIYLLRDKDQAVAKQDTFWDNF